MCTGLQAGTSHSGKRERLDTEEYRQAVESKGLAAIRELGTVIEVTVDANGWE